MESLTCGVLSFFALLLDIGTAADMQKIANKWSEFAPRVHKEYPHLLAEMCKFGSECIASALVSISNRP